MRTRFRSLLALLPVFVACGAPADPELPRLSISITQPAAKVYTKGDAVPVQLAISGGTPAKIEILQGPTVIATLNGDARSYTFVTASLAEGVYELTARASEGPLSFTSEVRTVVVDRTAPRISTRKPASGAANVSVREPIELVFDEVVTTSGASAVAVTLEYLNTAEVIPATAKIEQGYLLRVTPTGKLRTPAATDQLRLTLSANLTDLAGNALNVLDERWSWTVPRWQQLGGPLDADPAASTDASFPVLEFDGAANPVVAWLERQDLGTTTRAHVRQWKANAWSTLGAGLGPVEADPNAGAMDLAIDRDGAPIVAFRGKDGAAPAQFVHRWEGASWVRLGAPVRAHTPSSASNPIDKPFGVPSIDSTDSDSPVLAWDEYEPNPGEDPHGNTQKIVVAQYAGVSWDILGKANISASAGDNTPSTRPCVKRIPDSAYVGFQEQGSISVFAYSQSGEEWQPVGTPFAANGNGCSVDVRSGGNVFAAANVGTTFIPYFRNGSAWTAVSAPLSGAANGTMRLFEQSRPVVAYENGDVIRVERWNGSAWAALTSDLRTEATPGGIARARHPSIAISATGDVGIAWIAEVNGTAVVHVHRFNE